MQGAVVSTSGSEVQWSSSGSGVQRPPSSVDPGQTSRNYYCLLLFVLLVASNSRLPNLLALTADSKSLVLKVT